MTRSRFAVLFAIPVLLSLTVGCHKLSATTEAAESDGGGSGGARPTDCKLAGEWTGSLTITEADGVQLTPEMQEQVAAQIPRMKLSFTRTGGVTMTTKGRAMKFSRVGETVMGGDPFSGVVSNYEVLKLSGSETRVQLKLKNTTGNAPADHRDEVRYAASGVSEWTFTLKGDRVELRCTTTVTTGGRQSNFVMVGTFTRAGGRDQAPDEETSGDGW